MKIPYDDLRQYEDTKKALQERFEPFCIRNRYQAEFQTAKKKKEEEWADFADRLRILADKAFEFEDKAKEQLALNVFLAQLDDPQVAFSVRQKRPTTLDEAAAADPGGGGGGALGARAPPPQFINS